MWMDISCFITLCYLCIMISKATIKRIHSLETKKHRAEEGLFVAEGMKVVEELSREHHPVEVYYGEDANRASLLQHPQGVLALFRTDIFDAMKPSSSLRLMLDSVQDPGNVGTIVRIADWFGIDHIYCSRDTADVFSPKVVQASMGAIARVKVEYGDLTTILDSLPSGMPIYCTALDGSNIYEEELGTEGVIVVGNEGKGISEDVLRRATKRLFVPPYPISRRAIESLNVAVATAIVCAEFRRI